MLIVKTASRHVIYEGNEPHHSNHSTSLHLKNYTNYLEFRIAFQRGDRDIRFESLQPSTISLDNGISSHLKYTVAAIQSSELNGFS